MEQVPTTIRFSKYQAIGNDYLVVEAQQWADLLTPSRVRRICDRHLGIGSDGILVRMSPMATESFDLRILNPDGSEAEKSGNGLRIFARYLWDRGEVGEQAFIVRTRGGPVTCHVLDQGRNVTIDMGHARFNSDEIPVVGPAREVLRETMRLGNAVVEYSAVTLGNPHCVIFRPEVSADEAKSLGPLIETDARFPRRTNVQFVQVLDRGNLRAEIWERGAGYTLASGSSSCAVAAVARRLGFIDAEVTVHMPGGRLSIVINAEFEIRMTGPVAKVMDGEFERSALFSAA